MGKKSTWSPSPFSFQESSAEKKRQLFRGKKDFAKKDDSQNRKKNNINVKHFYISPPASSYDTSHG